MKRFLAIALAAVATSAMVTADFADARRLGGGRNLGAQRQSVAPPASPSAPSAAPAQAGPAGAAANPVMPPGAAAARATPGAAAAPAAAGTAARTGMSRWMGPMAGLAAGLGLAWLAHSLGFSEALLSALLIGLAFVVGIILIRALMSRRAQPQTAAPLGRSLGTGNPAGSPTRFEPVLAGAAGASARAAVSGRYPAGFDPVPFLEQSRQQFHRLQAAYDTGDRALLADVMTPTLFSEVSRELDERTSHVPTEVVALTPELVEVTTEGDEHWASVRFSGLLREDGATYPRPFDEMWNLVKPADGSSGWLLAGIRQLDTTPAGHA